MAEADGSRSVIVTVLGWAAIGAVVLIVRVATRVVVAVFASGHPERLEANLWLLVAVLVIASAVLLAAGIGLLRRRGWARATLEVLAWLSLCWAIPAGVLSPVSWIYRAITAAPGASSGPLAWWRVIDMLLVGLVWISATGVGIRLLRSAPVRAAMIRGGGGSPPQSVPPQASDA